MKERLFREVVGFFFFSSLSQYHAWYKICYTSNIFASRNITHDFFGSPSLWFGFLCYQQLAPTTLNTSIILWGIRRLWPFSKWYESNTFHGICSHQFNMYMRMIKVPIATIKIQSNLLLWSSMSDPLVDCEISDFSVLSLWWLEFRRFLCPLLFLLFLLDPCLVGDLDVFLFEFLSAGFLLTCKNSESWFKSGELLVTTEGEECLSPSISIGNTLFNNDLDRFKLVVIIVVGCNKFFIWWFDNFKYYLNQKSQDLTKKKKGSWQGFSFLYDFWYY